MRTRLIALLRLAGALLSIACAVWQGRLGNYVAASAWIVVVVLLALQRLVLTGIPRIEERAGPRGMSPRNARRIEERLERDRPKITEADVEEYSRVHYPEHIAEAYVPGRRGRPMPIPGDAYVAKLSHERFHEWFGTECDGTCPHRGAGR